MIITDIDFVDTNGKCCYDESKELFSSNYAIKNWFKYYEYSGKVKIDDSLKIGVADNQKLMITFQFKDDDGIWPRSFEDAFISSNLNLFDLEFVTNEAIFNKAKKFHNDKLNFAIKYGVDNDSEWNTPDYILEGLKWLSKVGD
nr:hypothetical protein [uncultured Methanobrevibacter sp.]